MLQLSDLAALDGEYWRAQGKHLTSVVHGPGGGKITFKLNGKLHALINNAGISPKLPDGGRINTLETDLRVWGQVFHVDFFCIRGFGQSVKR